MTNIETMPDLDNNTEMLALKKAIKENRSLRMHTRYLVIYNYLLGYMNIEIADRLNLCQHTVGTYIRKYKAGGLQSLVMGKSTGAPRHLTKYQEQELKQIIITKTPDEVGFIAKKNWNTTLLRRLVLKMYGVKFCQRGMLEVLYRMNLSFTKPTYTLEKADPDKQEKFKQEFELLKKST